MTSETIALALRAKITDQVATKGGKVSKKAWVAPVLEDFAHGRVLALDQTLTKTGFSVVTRDHQGLHVLEGALLRTDHDPDLSGFELTFLKAERMGQHFDALMMMTASCVDVVVHEMPAVIGYRLESSLMAAREVRRAAFTYARGVPVVMVSNQTMRAMLNAPGERKEKKYVKTAVEALIPTSRRITRHWNVDVCDSVGLALMHLYQKAKE
jgi:Holliday junction resolvasome RuvABC endonuclease subunit